MLLHQILKADNRIGDQQEQHAEIDGQITGCHCIEQVPADPAEIAFIFQSGRGKSFIHLLNCLHKPQFIYGLLAHRHIPAEGLLPVFGPGQILLIRHDKGYIERNFPVRYHIIAVKFWNQPVILPVDAHFGPAL